MASGPVVTTAPTALPESKSEPSAKQRVVRPRLPLATRIYYAIRLWGFKFVVWTFLRFVRLRHRILSALGPNLTRVYQIRPSLENRIYWPPSYNPKSGEKLPLFISIHGGGFALADPSVDDHLCRAFADNHGLLVVSLDYRKSPIHRFPTPVEDVATLVRAVLDDTRLPIDHSRTVIGGYSAGGNLALAVVQFPDIRARIKGLLPVYPAVDFAGKYRGSYRPTKDGRKDILEGTAPLFNWAYLPAGADLTNPLMSPIYAPREEFPDHIFFVGAECDVLVQEAEIMAKKLAGFPEGQLTGTKWQKNGVRWKLYWDMQHGFTHLRYKGYLEEERKAALKEFFRDAAEWMHKDVFKDQVS
ncbi:hypothetical protein DV737_g4699, partial [Chaetothyriales sp. CBS 132003]